MNRHKIVNWNVYVLIVVLTAVLAVLLIGDHRAEQAALEAEAKWQAERQPLLLRRSEITSSLVEMDRRENAVTGSSRAIVLFTAPDARILTEAVPLMTGAGFTGTIALGADAFPGDAGCLTVEQLSELTGQGWELCLLTEPGTDVAALHARVAEAGLPAPQALYAPEGSVDADALEAALALGIRVVIAYGGQPGGDVPEEISWIPAAGAMDDNLGFLYDTALAGRTAFAMTEGWVHARELFAADDLRISLETLTTSVAVDGLLVTSAAQAGQAYEQTRAEIAAMKAEHQVQRELLSQELAQVDAQLLEIDRRYGRR